MMRVDPDSLRLFDGEIIMCKDLHFFTIYYLYNRDFQPKIIDTNSYLYPLLAIARALQIEPNIKTFNEARPELESLFQESLKLSVSCRSNDDLDYLNALTKSFSDGIGKLLATMSLQQWQENFDDIYWLIQQGLKFSKRCEKVSFRPRSQKSKKKTSLEKDFHHEVAIHNLNMLTHQIMLLMANNQYTQAIRPCMDMLEAIKSVNIENDRSAYKAFVYIMLAIINAKEGFYALAIEQLQQAFRCDANGKFSLIRITTGFLDTCLMCASYYINRSNIKGALEIFQASLAQSKSQLMEIREQVKGSVFPDDQIENKYDNLKKAYHDFIVQQFSKLPSFNAVFSFIRMVNNVDGQDLLCLRLCEGKIFSNDLIQARFTEKNGIIRTSITTTFQLEKALNFIKRIINQNQPIALPIISNRTEKTILPSTTLAVLPPQMSPSSTSIVSFQGNASPGIFIEPKSVASKQRQPKGYKDNSETPSPTTVVKEKPPLIIFWKKADIQFNSADENCKVVPLSRGRGEQNLIAEGIWYGTIDSSIIDEVEEESLKRFKDILQVGNFVGRHGQGVKWLKQPIMINGFAYQVELKTCGSGERGNQRLFGRIADTADLSEAAENNISVRHPKLIIFDTFHQDGHKKLARLRH